MSVLSMVRHGQATPFEKETDRLSPLGEKQSRKLAEFWIRNNVVFDEVVSGSLVRQRRTAEIIGRCYADAGLSWPGHRINEDLNEFDGTGILNILAPKLAEQNTDFRQLLEKARDNRTSPDRNRHFQRMFEAVMDPWMSGALISPHVEPWESFRARVTRGIDEIISRSDGSRRVAVFTSGGPIGATVQRVFNAPPAIGIEINWRVRNCSVTEFLYSRGRITLDMFNAIPHLDEPDLHSFR